MPTLITKDNLAANTITAEKIASTVALGGPRIANVQIANSSWSQLDDTAVDTAGGYVIVNGSGFSSGCQVLINSTPATSVTFVSSSVLRVQVPAKDASTYVMYVVNPDGGTAVGVNALTYSGSPVWITGSTLSSQQKDVPISIQLSANGAASYSLQAGSSLPANTTLASNGLFSGTVSGISTTTSYSFTVIATDSENQDSPRTFTVSVSAITAPSQVEYLVVAGGGGGGSGGTGGAGGAGGVLYGTLSVSSGQQYNVVVGTGGNRGSSSGIKGSPGSNSTFASVTAQGGGYGGAAANDADGPGGSGGSGGGAGYRGNGIIPLGGSGVAGPPRQGYNGGSGATQNSGPYYGSGGGGGAGSAGGNGSSSTGGSGGIGTYNAITDGLGHGELYNGHYYVGGGGGGGVLTGGTAGTAGKGGGGGGGLGNATGGDGTAGFGGGGGGGGNALGGNGGSGVVILRYPDTDTAAVSTTGSPTVTTSGGYRYYKFTGDGSITF